MLPIGDSNLKVIERLRKKLPVLKVNFCPFEEKNVSKVSKSNRLKLL